LLDTIARAQNATSGVVDLILTLIALVVLMIRPPKAGRQSDSDGNWTLLDLKPISKAYSSLFVARHFGPVMSVALFASAVFVLPLFTDNASSLTLTTVIAFGIVALSVFLLTGRAGQLSLGQFAVAGVAAVASVRAVDATGVFFAGPIAAVVVGALTSLLLGLPALRSRGLVLPITTLAFALAARSWILPQEWALGDGLTTAQPIIGSLELDTPSKYYFYALAVLAVAVLFTWLVVRSRVGADLVALRDNEGAARALGVSRVRRRIQAFAIAGGLAGLGGSLFAHSRPLLTATEFPATASIEVVVMAAVGGLAAISGPLLGSLLVGGVPGLAGLDIVATAGLQLLFLVLILFRPGGFITVLLPIRDWIVEEVARLRGMDPTKVSDEPLPRSTPYTDRVELKLSAPETQAADPVLQVTGMSKSFGGVQAVRDVSLSVSPGEAVAIIGPNGAGKTTLFEMVAGFVRPDEGSVQYDGRDVTRRPAHLRSRDGLVRSFQNALLFPTMTVRETVHIAADQSRGDTDVDSTLESLGLLPYADEAIGSLPTGIRRMTELAADLTLQPRVLLLDEPSAGIAHAEIPGLARLLRTVHAQGVTLVVVDHDMTLLRAVCDRFIALDLGSILATGTADEVQADPQVVEAFLGPELAAVERSAPLATQSSEAQ
jgi:ABC-type branched-subunit amino acid transport system ATPase component/ABC-type branched-subunit amino acid transport system permease subunit